MRSVVGEFPERVGVPCGIRRDMILDQFSQDSMSTMGEQERSDAKGDFDERDVRRDKHCPGTIAMLPGKELSHDLGLMQCLEERTEKRGEQFQDKVRRRGRQ